MKNQSEGLGGRHANGLEENLKKALTELLILHIFSEGEHYIGELAEIMKTRSHGVLSIVFPYAAIYRVTEAGYLTETKKRIAPDGRRRQYYALTEEGLEHLRDMLVTYHAFSQGVEDILSGGEAP